MATTGAEAYFVYTNILVYATVSSSPFHPAARTKLDGLRRGGSPLWINRQVIREYLAVLTRGTPPMVPKDHALDAAMDLTTLFGVADDDARVTLELFSLLRR